MAPAEKGERPSNSDVFWRTRDQSALLNTLELTLLARSLGKTAGGRMVLAGSWPTLMMSRAMPANDPKRPLGRWNYLLSAEKNEKIEPFDQ
jgi:hypothetical protein